MRVIALLNAAAGGGSSDEDREAAERVRAALAEQGVDADVRCVPGERLARAVSEAAAERPDAVVVGGGDGTLSAAAGVLLDGEVPLGVLPLGTLNHFARDLGVPLDLDEAATVVASGEVRSVDVGEVNGCIFLNNASVGVYPQIVEVRDDLGHRGRVTKLLALARAAAVVFRRGPVVPVTVEVDGEVMHLRSPAVIVGNNEYEMDLTTLGRRLCLDNGELSVYIARTTTRRGVVRLLMRTLLGRLAEQDDVVRSCVPELEVDSPRGSLRIALDGEVQRMRTPLRYRIRAGALPVIAPPARDGA